MGIGGSFERYGWFVVTVRLAFLAPAASLAIHRCSFDRGHPEFSGLSRRTRVSSEDEERTSRSTHQLVERSIVLGMAGLYLFGDLFSGFVGDCDFRDSTTTGTLVGFFNDGRDHRFPDDDLHAVPRRAETA